MTRSLRRVLFGAVALAMTSTLAANAQDLSTDPVQDPNFIPGKLWVQFTHEAPAAGGSAQTGFDVFDQIAEQFDVESVEKAFPILDRFASKRALSESGEALRRTYEVTYSGPYDPLSVAAEFTLDPNVVYAEPRYMHQIFKLPEETADPLVEPDDPRWSSQDDYLDRVEIEEAWDVVKGEDGDVVIAIVDGGTDWDHEDLEANIWENPDEVADNGVDDDDNGFVDDIRGWNFADDSNDPTGLPATPSNGNHGTATAGAAAAATNNATGMAGTSWNSIVMPINAGCENAEFICHSVKGILYGAMNGADLINASYGSSNSSETARLATQTALDEGALVVAASGNDGTDNDRQPFFPAGYSTTLSVGGTQKVFDINVFNYGRSVNVYLAGEGISVTLAGNSYSSWSGTSFSAPLAAGIAALVKTENPDWTPEQVREQMRLTADSIDDSNPSVLNGKLGRGRVNANRAVTEDPVPGVRLVEWSWIDDDGNGALIGGESATLTAEFTNFHGDAEGLTVGIEAESASEDHVDITTATVDIGSLENGESTTATFEFILEDAAPDNRTLLLYTRITADGDLDDSPDIMRIPYNNTATATHHNDALKVSITNEGNIGYLSYLGDPGGVGFLPTDANGEPRDILFEGGLIVARSEDEVSDCLRGEENQATDDQNDDFGLKDDTNIELITDGALTSQQGRVTLVETASTGTVGVEILQDSYVSDTEEHEDGIILRYTLLNVTESTIEDVYVGLFFDWDVGATFSDEALWDDERQMGYIAEPLVQNIIVGTKVLTSEGDISYRAIDNPAEIYRNQEAGGFTDDEKFEWISEGVTREELDGVDLSAITGVGPFTIESGSSQTVAFAVVAGTSVDDFFANVDALQALWDDVIFGGSTAIEEGETPIAGPVGLLRAVYPNPALMKATLSYELETAGEISLAVYDILGRRIRTVWSGQKSAGVYETEWDGLNDNGARVVPGVYMVTITATDGHRTVRSSRPLVIAR